MNAPDHRSALAITQALYMASNADHRLVCVACLGDNLLREIVKSSAMPGQCAACGNAGNGLPIGEIAMHLDNVIKKLWYGVFPTNTEHSTGTPLRAIVQEVLNEQHACEDAIIEALKSIESNGMAGGTFYSDTALYERRQAAGAARQ